MDLLYFLKVRLKFITELYNSAVSGFEETKRKIEIGEPPYVDERNPEYADEPAFLEEWQQANDAVMVIGHWCFCMVHASLAAYLKECIGPVGSIWWDPKALRESVAKKSGGNWFGRYRLLFLEDLGLDWNKGPVALSELEQLNLTRDDLIHNVDVFSMNVPMGDQHAKKYPTSLFTDDLWYGVTGGRVRIDRPKLELATRLVWEFCGWLDDFRLYRRTR